jgi:putative RecB family exonuclease
MASQIYSHSRLSTFEDCAKRFQYRYVLKIPSDIDGIEAFVGKRVHEVLERLYIAVGKGLTPSLEKVLFRFNALFDEAYDPERVRIVREGTPLSFYRKLGERCTADYYRSMYPFDQDETIAVEHHVKFALDNTTTYRFQGFVDRISRARDGTIEICDYKTSKRMPSQAKLDEDRQLALYQIGLTEKYPDQPIRLVWYFLAHNRRVTSTRTPDQLELLRAKVKDVVDRIGEETEYKAKRSALCDWCEYNHICPIYPKEKLAKARLNNPAVQPQAVSPAAEIASDPTKPSQKNQLNLL